MPDHMKTDVWLLGAGTMALDYFRVLHHLDHEIKVIGRGQASADSFAGRTDVRPFVGGLASFLETSPICCTHAVVAVSIDELADTTIQLLEYGVKNILVEKPAGLNSKEINLVANIAHQHNAIVYVAYNRRFYAATLMAKQFILNDGGVTSFNFEFTEWSHEIEKLKLPMCIKQNWFLANSTHVIDLAFYLGGKPSELNAFHAGSLDWHPSSAVFSGAGRTIDGKLFSYSANWDAPGRWGAEFCTKNFRLIFRPMESLQIMRKGSVSIKTFNVEGQDLDNEFKPGLFLQTKAFLDDNENADLCRLSDHVKMLPVYSEIAGYS
jgi:predicted dehydrogenase